MSKRIKSLLLAMGLVVTMSTGVFADTVNYKDYEKDSDHSHITNSATGTQFEYIKFDATGVASKEPQELTDKDGNKTGIFVTLSEDRKSASITTEKFNPDSEKDDVYQKAAINYVHVFQGEGKGYRCYYNNEFSDMKEKEGNKINHIKIYYTMKGDSTGDSDGSVPTGDMLQYGAMGIVALGATGLVLANRKNDEE